MGTVVPAAFIAFGFLQQGHLGEALRQDWWAVVLAIVVLAILVGAATVALRGRFPLLASLVAEVASAWVSTVMRLP